MAGACFRTTGTLPTYRLDGYIRRMDVNGHTQVFASSVFIESHLRIQRKKERKKERKTEGRKVSFVAYNLLVISNEDSSADPRSQWSR